MNPTDHIWLMKLKTWEQGMHPEYKNALCNAQKKQDIEPMLD